MIFTCSHYPHILANLLHIRVSFTPRIQPALISLRLFHISNWYVQYFDYNQRIYIPLIQIWRYFLLFIFFDSNIQVNNQEGKVYKFNLNLGEVTMREGKKKVEQTQQQLRFLAKRYEMKQLNYTELWNIYSKNALSPHFRTTMYSALILIIFPSLTNVFYTFRPNATMAKVMPFVMPVVCMAQYITALKYDLQKFCFQETDDSETLRRKYKELSKFEFYDDKMKKIAQNIEFYQNNKDLFVSQLKGEEGVEKKEKERSS